jgi:hypothetical protein
VHGYVNRMDVNMDSGHGCGQDCGLRRVLDVDIDVDMDLGCGH